MGRTVQRELQGHLKPPGAVSRELAQQVKNLVRPLGVGEVCGREKPPEKGVMLNQLVDCGMHPLHMQEGLRAPDLQVLQVSTVGEVVPDEAEIVVGVRKTLRQKPVNGGEPLVFVDVAVGAVQVAHCRGIKNRCRSLHSCLLVGLCAVGIAHVDFAAVRVFAVGFGAVGITAVVPGRVGMCTATVRGIGIGAI